MSCNTYINLSPTTSVNRVAEAIAKLMGHPGKVDKDSSVSAYRVSGYKVKGYVDIPQMCAINIKTDTPLLQQVWHDAEIIQWHYHFEDDRSDWRCLSPGSHALAIAVGRELVKLFGGTVQYNDAEGGIQFRRPKKTNYSSTDAQFAAWQKKLAALKPLTVKQVMKFNSLAAYPLEVKPLAVAKKAGR